MNVYGNNEARSGNHCCSGKPISITYSECVFIALGIQHAMCMHRIMFSSVACPAVPYYHINGTILRGNPVIEHNTCVLSVQLCLKYFSF